MTRNWHSSAFVFVLFLVTVYSIQNSISQASNGAFCSKNGYSCIKTRECVERHSGRAIDEVLFQCDGGKKICCPPEDFSKFDESDQICTRSSCTPIRPSTHHQPNDGNPVKPQRNEGASGADGNNGHNRFQNKPKGQVSGSRRPSQAEQPQISPTRPPQVQQPHVPSTRPPQAQQEYIPSTRPPQAQQQYTPSTRPPVEQPQVLPTRPPQVQQPQIPSPRPPPPSNQNYSPQNFQIRPLTIPPSTQNSHHLPLNPQDLQHRPQTSQSQPAKKSDSSTLTSHRNFKLLPSEANCGVNNFANRITEGEEVSLGEYPWMVLTGLKDREGNYRWNCGGTLISGRYVLTAAHCVIVDNRTIEYVRLGEHNLTNDTDCYKDLCLEEPEDISIEEVIPHEKWNTTTIKNDIALLRLSRNPLLLGKSNIYPICLPVDKKKLNLTSTTKYEVAGWGKTDWNADEGSDVLRKASISGVNHEECNICKGEKKQQYCPITDSQLCVQGWKSVDVCKGDSGGPLMITRLNIYQIGITSFKGTEYCGAENIPSIFTRVESFLPWILDNIRE